MELSGVEFYATPKGEVKIAVECGAVQTYELEHRDFTEAMLVKIGDFYPGALKALSDLYRASAHNRRYQEYLIVHRFIRCNFSEYDSKSDIDCNGAFNFEEVKCPLRGECTYCGVVCKPIFNTKLSERELEVMRNIYGLKSPDEIAKELFISPETVKKHKRNALQKLGLRSIPEFLTYAARNQLFSEE